MISILLFVILQLLQSPEIPYRNKEDFQVELKYDLRPRSNHNPGQFDFDPTGVKKPKVGSTLPYLTVSVKIINTTPEEIRFRCDDNRGARHFNRKLPKEGVFLINMGFVDDIKDRLTADTFEVFALSAKKEPINRIHMKIEKDGTFLVNGEKRGKF